jgi:hypothetical protein
MQRERVSMALPYRTESPHPNSMNPAPCSTPTVASNTSAPAPASTVHNSASQNYENHTQAHYPWHDTGEQLDSSHTSAETLRVQYIQDNPFQNPGPATNPATADPEPSMRTPPQTPAAGANKLPASNGLHDPSACVRSPSPSLPLKGPLSPLRSFFLSSRKEIRLTQK